MKKTFSIILSLIILAGIGFGIFWAARATLYWFAGLQSEVGVAVIAASATIFTSTLAIVLGRYFEGKKDREAAHRDKKVALYDEFTQRLFSIFSGDANSKTPDNLVPYLREVQRKLMLWAGPKVVKKYAEWHRILTSQGNDPKAKAMIVMVEFFLALIEDLGLSNKGIEKEHIVRFMLQNPDLFMSMYKKNENVSFREIVEMENTLRKNTSKSLKQT